MKAEKVEKLFRFNGVDLPDIPGYSPDMVRNHYATIHPELTNATIKGPSQENGKAVYSFNVAVGTKG